MNIRTPLKLLCSGVALGVYVPGLIIFKQLKKRDVDVGFLVLEDLFSNDKKSKILDNKIAFHRDFRVALIGQRIAGDISRFIDNSLLDILLEQWYDQKINRFMLFSGYWLPVIETYVNKYAIKEIHCDLCYMDSVESPSWRNYNFTGTIFKKKWFFNYDQNCVNYYLNIGNYQPIPFKDRKQKFVIHGGGWGMGTYSKYITELNVSNLYLDIVTYEYKDLKDSDDRNRYFMIDPNWKTWERNENNEYSFPPFGIVENENKISFLSNDLYPDIYDLERESLAIISKPGGGSLLHSLCSATPLVFLESCGNHEEKNGLLWQSLGLGISMLKWREINYSFTVLEHLHENLLRVRNNAKNFTDTLIDCWS